jgi:putative tricarboxylic transport membrane protein
MEQLINGFIASLSLVNIVACFLGCLLGTIVGVLPGLGSTATMALLLPFTFMYNPTTSLIMLTGIWYGSQYGGSTTSILVNIPGEATSVVTCIDGYQMAKKGRGGAALALAGIGSFVAGTIGIIGLQFAAPLLGKAALSFGPLEYFSFLIFAFILLSNLSGESPLRGFVMLVLGLWVSSIGLNPLDSNPRFSLGSNRLMKGIGFLPLVMGLYGIAEILNISVKTYIPPILQKLRLRDLYPSREEIKRSVHPMWRGSVLGFFIGLLPGPATIISPFICYSIEKRLTKRPQEFGHGAVEGVVAPEAANNSAMIGSMIPLLTLGIPFAAPAAVLLAGLRMNNVEPGPLLFQQRPEMFWTFIAAMYIGNIMLLVLNLPLVGIFARLATIRPQILMPFITVICLVGVYCVDNSLFDVWIMIVAGIVGYFFNKWKYPVAPFIVGIILGPMTENSLRQSLMILRGNFSPVLERPIALAFLFLGFAFIGYRLLSNHLAKNKRRSNYSAL